MTCWSSRRLPWDTLSAHIHPVVWLLFARRGGHRRDCDRDRAPQKQDTVIVTLLLTILIEGLIVCGFALWRKKPIGRILAASVLANLLTQSLLWGALNLFPESLLNHPVRDGSFYLAAGGRHFALFSRHPARLARSTVAQPGNEPGQLWNWLVFAGLGYPRRRLLDRLGKPVRQAAQNPLRAYNGN